MSPKRTTGGAPKESISEALGRIGEGLREELAIDRTGIDGHRVVPLRAKAAAWAAIIGLYALGWGGGVQRAVEVAFRWVPAIEVWPVPSFPGQTSSLIRYLAVVLLAASLIWVFRQYAGARVRAATWTTSIKTFPVGYLAVTLGFAFATLLNRVVGFQENQLELSPIDDPLQLALSIVNDGMAGPTEELALLALVVVALRATGHGWWTVVIAAIVLRVPFHLYYGWGAIGLAVWAALMVALYRRTGAIVAIILAHATFNMLNYLGLVGGVVKPLIAVFGILVIMITPIHRFSRESKLPSP